MPRAFVIFCDDVRTEISGKDIIIGVYQQNLFAHARDPEQPVVVQVRPYITIDDVGVAAGQSCDVAMKLLFSPHRGGDEIELAAGNFQVQVPVSSGDDGRGARSRIVVAPPPVRFALEADGRITVDLTVNGQKCEVIGGIEVRRHVSVPQDEPRRS